MCCCQYMSGGYQGTTTFPTKFSQIICVSNKSHPRPSSCKFRILNFKLFTFAISFPFLQVSVPSSAGSPPTIRVCVTLENPQPSSTVSIRPRISAVLVVGWRVVPISRLSFGQHIYHKIVKIRWPLVIKQFNFVFISLTFGWT